MGNVIPVLINTDSMHEIKCEELLDDIRYLCNGNSLPSDFRKQNYYAAGPAAGRALDARSDVQVGVYHHSSERHVFMTEYTNLYDMNASYCERRASHSVADAERELKRVQAVKADIADAERRVKVKLAALKRAEMAPTS